MENIVEVKQLSVKYKEGFTLEPIDLYIKEGEIISVVGESGSGKSTFGKAIVRLLEEEATISGNILINGENILSFSKDELRDRRLKEFSICFQNSNELLNPLLTIREQLYEVLIKKYPKKELDRIVKELLDDVGLYEEVLNKYPKELSGGMIQKILIITSICLKPKFVILDEPTSSLDIESRKQVLDLIKSINKKYNISFLIVTHDLNIARDLSARTMVLYRGHAVEIGDSKKIIERPKHPYSRGLINSSMDINPYRDIWGIRHGDKCLCEETEGCSFFYRCTQRLDSCEYTKPKVVESIEEKDRFIACNRGGIVKVLEGKKLIKKFDNHKIIDNISVDLLSSEVVSLVGSSGVGKTTLSSMLAGYLEFDSGEILFEGTGVNFKELHKIKNGLQMIFQDPTTSINPNLSVLDAVSEPLRLSYKEDLLEPVQRVLYDVGLPTSESFLKSKIKSLSGGQKQRISVARAIIMDPKVLIADEPTSMLDASSKANLLRLLKGIQNSRGFSMLIITHDLSSAMKISDRIYILENSRNIIELTDTSTVNNYFSETAICKLA